MKPSKWNRLWPRIPALFALPLGVLSALAGMSSCGIPEGSQSADDGSPRWEGTIAFATQCPYGMVSSTKQAPLTLRDCPVGLKELKLIKPPSTFLFSGDCREKTLAIRTADLSLDTLWQVTPDNRFNLSAGPVWTQLSEDADGHGPCWTAAEISVRGELECEDQDRMKIRFDWVSLTLAPGLPETEWAPEGQRCHLPASCELGGQAILNQCL